MNFSTSIILGHPKGGLFSSTLLNLQSTFPTAHTLKMENVLHKNMEYMIFINHFTRKLVTISLTYKLKFKMMTTFKLLLSLNYVASEDSMTQTKLNQLQPNISQTIHTFPPQPMYFQRNGHMICSTEVVNFVESWLEFRKRKIHYFVKKKNWAVIVRRHYGRTVMDGLWQTRFLFHESVTGLGATAGSCVVAMLCVPTWPRTRGKANEAN